MLNYIETGCGDPVILIHGMAASLYDWQTLAPALAQAGYRAFAVDLLGHGASPKPKKPDLYSFRFVYAVLEDWIRSLELESPIHLIGHSLGGYLSLRYALRHPQFVASLTLINPLYSLKQISPVLRLFHQRPGVGIQVLRLAPLSVIEWALSWNAANLEHIAPQARRQIAIDYKRASPHILNITRHLPDLTPDLGRIQPPTLLIWGERDQTLAPKSYPLLASRLPHCIQRSLADGGHQPHIGKAEYVNREILQFLGGLSPGSLPLSEARAADRPSDRVKKSPKPATIAPA